MKKISTKEAIVLAGCLCDGRQNENYMKGVCEMLAVLYPKGGVHFADRAVQIEWMIKEELADSDAEREFNHSLSE